MMRKAHPQKFFTNEEQRSIEAEIAAAEKETTGEISVRIERRCSHDPLKHAEELLKNLRFSSKHARTAVLIYLCLEDRKVAIYGDQAIHEKIGERGWQEICNHLVTHFQKEQFVEGIHSVIRKLGLILKEHFPLDPGSENPNELPDTPSFG